MNFEWGFDGQSNVKSIASSTNKIIIHSYKHYSRVGRQMKFASLLTK